MPFEMGDVINFVKQAHEGQFRQNSGLPYWSHLEAVANTLNGIGADGRVVAAGWLHDSIEDTDATYYDIWDLTDQTTADIVWNCTDTPGLKGNARRTEKLKHLVELPEYDQARLVMQADLLHNLQSQLNGYSLYGDMSFSGFGGKIGILKYYREKAGVLHTWRNPITDQIDNVWYALYDMLEPDEIDKMESAHVFDEYK